MKSLNQRSWKDLSKEMLEMAVRKIAKIRSGIRQRIRKLEQKYREVSEKSSEGSNVLFYQ